MAILDKVFRWLGHGRYYSSLPTPASSGDVVETLTDSYGRPRVVIDSMPGSGGSSAYSAYIHTGLVFQAQVKESAGTVRQVVVTNTDSVDAWFALFDLATMPGLDPGDLDTIKTFVVVPASDTVSLTFAADVSYSDGIAFMAFTTADLDTEFAAKLKVHLLYTLPARAP